MSRRIAIVVALAVTVVVGSLLLAIGAGAFRGGGDGEEAGQVPTQTQQAALAGTEEPDVTQGTPDSPDGVATSEPVDGEQTPGVGDDEGDEDDRGREREQHEEQESHEDDDDGHQEEEEHH